jgi:hypothetical protein
MPHATAKTPVRTELHRASRERTRRPDDRGAGAWIKAAAALATRELPLLVTVHDESEDMAALYDAFATLADQMEGKTRRTAQSRLEALDEACKPQRETMPAPSDVACDFYTPQIDAAYYLGFVIGARLARTLDGAREWWQSTGPRRRRQKRDSCVLRRKWGGGSACSMTRLRRPVSYGARRDVFH